MYFMKLTSSVSVVEVVLAVEKISTILKMNPGKLERMLLDGEAIIAKTTTMEKARRLTRLFRSAGVKTAIVEK